MAGKDITGNMREKNNWSEEQLAHKTIHRVMEKDNRALGVYFENTEFYKKPLKEFSDALNYEVNELRKKGYNVNLRKAVSSIYGHPKYLVTAKPDISRDEHLITIKPNTLEVKKMSPYEINFTVGSFFKNVEGRIRDEEYKIISKKEGGKK